VITKATRIIVLTALKDAAGTIKPSMFAPGKSNPSGVLVPLLEKTEPRKPPAPLSRPLFWRYPSTVPRASSSLSPVETT
jgi:hypothetical protein